MSNIVRAALVQQKWTGDKESMIANAVEHIGSAASQGAQVVCLQELFYGPYFCQVQDADYYSYTEAIPDGPTTQLMSEVADAAQHRADRADVRAGAAGRLLQHRGRDRRGRHVPRQAPQEPHPAGQGLLGEVLLQARQPRLPGVRHRGRPDRRLHLLRAALPRGLARAGPGRRARSCSTRRRPRVRCREYLWRLEQPAAAVANEYFVGAINRVGVEPLGDNEFYGQTYFADPRGQLVGEAASDIEEELVVRDLDMDLLTEVRDRGRSTATAAPTPTTGPGDAVSTLIRNGTVINADGLARRGRAGRGRAHRGTGRRRGSRCRPTKSSTPAGSTSARRHRRPHAHGDAVRRHVVGGHVRHRHDARRRGAARPRSSTSPCRPRVPPCCPHWTSGTRRPTATARSTTAST